MGTLWLWLIGVALAAVLLVGIAAWLLMRAQDEETRRIGQRIARLPWRQKGHLFWTLLRDGRIPLWLKAMIPLLVLYLAMPLDVIPDFIPVLGYLDDLVLVIVAAGVVVRFTPREVLEERLAALEGSQDGERAG